MSFRDTKTLDRPTAILLSSLSISVNSAVRMVWRRSYSGGDVLEDIGGRVMTADGAAANNRPRAAANNRPRGFADPVWRTTLTIWRPE